MALTEDEAFLYKEVFTKIKRDPVSKTYIIPVDAYLPLDLNTKQLKLLEKICQDNDIELEKLPKQITYAEGEKLLIEYHQIKEQIENNPRHQDIATLKDKQLKLKERIAMGYMAVVYKLINKKIPNLDEERDREDIYQTGYVVLLEFIDTYNPTYKTTFDKYLRFYLISNLLRRIIMTSRGLNSTESEYIKQINNAKRKLNSQQENTNIIPELSKITGFSVDKVEYLLLLEDVSRLVSLEELSKDILQEVLADDYDIDSDIEQRLLSRNLIKVLDTLKVEQREVIMLYYGLKDGKRYTHEEIAKLLGYKHHENIRYLKYEALKTLSLPIYKMYLSNEFSEEFDIEEYLHTQKELPEQKRINELEIYLLEQLPETLLKDLMNLMFEPEKSVLLMTFGLQDGIQYTEQEIGKLINKATATVKIIKGNGMNQLRNLIKQEILKDNRDSRYFDYLFQLYLNKPKRKH